MSERTAGRLYERLVRDLEAKIAQGEYAVGDRLPGERRLAQIYGVSRPTVREAVIALELDGMVEVRQGSGVYVVSPSPVGGVAAQADMGPFEVLEARRAIEGESCALAAQRITDGELAELVSLVDEMRAENARDVVMSEDADRRFHIAVARATQNSAIIAAVEMLWDARARSPQYRLMSDKAHAAGVKPRIDEHAAVVAALRTRDPVAARRAMVDHLTQVLDALLKATEVIEFEEARRRVAAHRERYAVA